MGRMMCASVGFPGGSYGEESAHNVGDLALTGESVTVVNVVNVVNVKCADA